MRVGEGEEVAFFVFANIEGLSDVDVGELSGDAGLLEQFHGMPSIMDERAAYAFDHDELIDPGGGPLQCEVQLDGPLDAERPYKHVSPERDRGTRVVDAR